MHGIGELGCNRVWIIVPSITRHNITSGYDVSCHLFKNNTKHFHIKFLILPFLECIEHSLSLVYIFFFTK